MNFSFVLCLATCRMRSNPCDTVARFCARPVRFRRGPFVRDVFCDHGRASVPRITGPHMLPSTLLTVSASAEFWFSRLNSTPHTITVYASQPPSPATTQHSLPGARYGLPGPVSHRQDNASFPGAQAIHTSFSPRAGSPACVDNGSAALETMERSHSPINSSHSSSVSTVTPCFLASASFDPAPGPAMR